MRLLAALLALLLPVGAQAQETALESLLRAPLTAPAIPPGEDRMVALDQGDRAPFTGILLDTDTAIRWTNALRWWPDAFRLRMDSVSSAVSLIEQYGDQRLRITEESRQREIDGLRQDLRTQAQQAAQAAERPWYTTFTFGLVVGVVVAGVLVGLGAWLLSEIP